MAQSFSLPQGVYLADSGVPGSTVALFTGVHGNELGGIKALDQIRATLTPITGRVYMVYANPAAIAASKRMLGKNLNRCFFPNNNGTEPEDIRARELMPILDASDVLLDLHTFNDPTGEAFIICEDNALELARKLSPTIISTGWNDAEPGPTEGYMYRHGKIGLCLESGPTVDVAASTNAALAAIDTVLKTYGVIQGNVASVHNPKTIIAVDRAVIRTSADFELDSALQSFQALTAGQVLGHQAGEALLAGENEYIIFPRPQAPIGAEAYIIGKMQ